MEFFHKIICHLHFVSHELFFCAFPPVFYWDVNAITKGVAILYTVSFGFTQDSTWSYTAVAKFYSITELRPTSRVCPMIPVPSCCFVSCFYFHPWNCNASHCCYHVSHKRCQRKSSNVTDLSWDGMLERWCALKHGLPNQIDLGPVPKKSVCVRSGSLLVTWRQWWCDDELAWQECGFRHTEGTRQILATCSPHPPFQSWF